MRARSPATALIAAAACAAFAALVWALAFHAGFAMRADAAALHGFERLQDTRAAGLADLLTRLCDPLAYAILATAVVL
jgi:hypothetical protein